jgi:hypothetical protein
MYTDDRDYTAMRLVNTVVRDMMAVELVTILDIQRGGAGFIATVSSFDEEKGNYITPLEYLDLSSPPLGNINYRQETYYISRMPKRNDWRQGLRRENLVATYRGTMGDYGFPSLNVLKAPVYDKYWSYKKCLGKNRAFSKAFSVDKEGKIWYKCREVVGKDADGVPVLDEKFAWLEEALQDALE